MTEIKGFRVPVANTCHMQEKKPHLGCSTEDWMGWCSAGPCNLAVQGKAWDAEPKKILQNCICSVHANKSRTLTTYCLKPAWQLASII